MRVLALCWNYPTPAAPQRGLWTQRMCHAAALLADVTVIVPTPWVPPLMPFESLARFRAVPVHVREGAVDVYYPRVPGSIEYSTHSHDARLARWRVLALARRLHEERRFDLIHAHFIFPDGVVASYVGRKLGIPVMTTEQALWSRWFSMQPSEGAQVDAHLPGIKLIAPVSEFLRRDVDRYLNGRTPTLVLPNVVDDAVFYPLPVPRDQNELLYVGLIRQVKRVDVLIRALALVRRTMPEVHLRILAANALRAYDSERHQIVALIAELGLTSTVEFVYGSDPTAVAGAMRRCALVVVSSTRETFCCVAAEAIACGTPLVTTRCGGPEEFFTPEDGVMVAPDDPEALAEGILHAMRNRGSYDPVAMHARMVTRFGRKAWCEQALQMYTRVAHG